MRENIITTSLYILSMCIYIVTHSIRTMFTICCCLLPLIYYLFRFYFYYCLFWTFSDIVREREVAKYAAAVYQRSLSIVSQPLIVLLKRMKIEMCQQRSTHRSIN